VILRPGPHGIERRAVEAEAARDAQRDSRQAAHDTKTQGTPHGPFPNFEAHPLSPGASGMIDGVTPVFEKVMMQIDFHRASIGARAAKG